MLVYYPGYREFQLSRIGASDAMMALLVSSRLARHTLTLNEEATLRLPQIFPRVPEIRRLDRTVADTQALIDAAERHLAYMAIPYALSVYGALVVDALLLLNRESKYSGKDPEKLTGGELHNSLKGATGQDLPSIESELYMYTNETRNRIIHHAATGSTALLRRFIQLTPPARRTWEKMSRRPLAPPGHGMPLELESPELIAVLALTNRLAQAVNRTLQTTLSRPTWALVAVEDFRDTHRRKWNDPGRRERSLRGYIRQLYGPLSLNEAEISAGERATH